MTDQPPEPPAHLSTDVAEVLDDSDPRELLAAARYAEALAEYRQDTATVSDDGARSASTAESDRDPEETPERGSAERQSRRHGTGGEGNGAGEDNGVREADNPQEGSEDRPTDVPSNASVTVKTINGNRYRYWQWRDGEKIRSKYIEPVGTDE